jgi:hypothetical protein
MGVLKKKAHENSGVPSTQGLTQSHPALPWFFEKLTTSIHVTWVSTGHPIMVIQYFVSILDHIFQFHSVIHRKVLVAVKHDFPGPLGYQFYHLAVFRRQTLFAQFVRRFPRAYARGTLKMN